MTPPPSPASEHPVAGAVPADWLAARNLRLAARLDRIAPDTASGRGLIREGILRRAVGLTLEAVGCEAPMGANSAVEETMSSCPDDRRAKLWNGSSIAW